MEIFQIFGVFCRNVTGEHLAYFLTTGCSGAFVAALRFDTLKVEKLQVSKQTLHTAQDHTGVDSTFQYRHTITHRYALLIFNKPIVSVT